MISNVGIYCQTPFYRKALIALIIIGGKQQFCYLLPIIFLVGTNYVGFGTIIKDERIGDNR